MKNVDLNEVEKFNSIASEWWDPHGPFKPLHQLNPCRLDFVKKYTKLSNKKVLDVGCGGGILSESLARNGAHVTGIDMAEDALQVAKQHASQSQLNIDYQHITAEEFAEQHAGQFDVITCMELLEHVPNPESLIKACARLAKPEGQLFFSTLNRTPKAFLLAIAGAEYVLRLLPRGTHTYSQFLRPSELENLGRQAQLSLAHLSGMKYNPLTEYAELCSDLSINYLAHFRR